MPCRRADAVSGVLGTAHIHDVAANVDEKGYASTLPIPQNQNIPQFDTEDDLRAYIAAQLIEWQRFELSFDERFHGGDHVFDVIFLNVRRLVFVKTVDNEEDDRQIEDC